MYWAAPALPRYVDHHIGIDQEAHHFTQLPARIIPELVHVIDAIADFGTVFPHAEEGQIPDGVPRAPARAPPERALQRSRPLSSGQSQGA